MTEDFWNQFWPQFWGGVASTLFLAILAIVFTYVARLKIVLFMRGIIRNIQGKVLMEEEKIKAEYISKK